MENLSHTLLGLSLAKAGLERATPLATATLIISSNLPDVDVIVRARGALAYLEHHRGFTHSFAGLAVLAAALTLVLVYFDRKFRLRRDTFRRPIRPARIFLIAYLGGLGHLFMDFTNNYGARPLLPFSGRWFYGDIVFVVDPWVWLILGSAAVWLTATSSLRVAVWLAVGICLSIIMAVALREPYPALPVSIPTSIRAGWFAGLGLIVVGAALGWHRAGQSLARYSLLVLGLYYGAMWIAHQSALEQAASSLPVPATTSLAAWPTPANPLLWQAVATTHEAVYNRYVDLAGSPGDWREGVVLEPKFVEALHRSPVGSKFLQFARYTSASVTEREDGYTIELRDLRFDLRLNAELDSDLEVRSAAVRWF
jgi:inner membrane protein